jgi:hypothetical protein
VLVGLLSVGFAFGAWSRAGLYCNHQVCRGCGFVALLVTLCVANELVCVGLLPVALFFEPAAGQATAVVIAVERRCLELSQVV